MPSSPNYKRDYKQEARTDSPLRKKKRAMRNKARRVAQKAGLVKKVTVKTFTTKTETL